MSQTAEPASARPEQERELFFGISAARLRSRARWGLIVLLVSVFIPYDLIGKTPIFVWDVMGELPLSSAIALSSLPLAGLAIALGLIFTKRGASLGFVVLASLLSVAVLRKFGADRAAWDVVRVPDAFSTRPAGAIVAVALTSAASNLKFRAATRHLVPYVLGAAGASALYFYAWPERGEAPFRTILRALKALPTLTDFRLQIGLALIVFVMIWPLVITGSGLALIRYTPDKDESWLTMVANWSLGLWMVLLATRTLLMPQAGLSLMSYLATISVVIALIVLLSAATVVVLESFFVPAGDEVATRTAGNFDDDEPKKIVERSYMAPRLAAIVAAASVVVLGATQLVLSRPPKKGTDWTLGEPKEKANTVFVTDFGKWAWARRRWDLDTREHTGATARVEVKSSGKELVTGAKEVDPALGRAFDDLVTESDDLDLSGRKWSRLIGRVNEASRAAKLPYYIDPDFMMKQEPTGALVTHFFAHVYQIEEVHQWDVGGAPFATLLVHRIDQVDAEHFRLGFSRDEQPFALVNVESTKSTADDFKALVKLGACTDSIVWNPRLYQGLERCGELYKEYANGREEEIEKAVRDGTERHELQHQVDGPHLPLAGAVLDLLEGYDAAAQDRVNREASAFIAELTADGMAPKLTLVQLAQHLFGSDDQRGVYAKTAVVVFEALAGKTIRRADIADGQKFWPIYEALFEKTDDRLRALAAETWQDMFDAELAQPKLN